ncbi:unnamed protein product [Linum tenue]|uniref:Uncharacterized protein n=1 Tax=Linum tenue TaxID=586396 RepID=A0AAV0S160_9ROSI|nr:unnamed protein product [Linum tenue]
MCHTINTLFSDFGVHTTVYELDEMPRGREIEQALARQGVGLSAMTSLWCSSEGSLWVVFSTVPCLSCSNELVRCGCDHIDDEN